MLSKKEKNLLAKELKKIDKINKRVLGQLLPEEVEFFKKEWPAGGYHSHDEDNPFGMHRHYLDDPIDGAHTHSPQNPGGEHVHGEYEGRALIDGKHYHNEVSTGYHAHENCDDDGQVVPQDTPSAGV